MSRWLSCAIRKWYCVPNKLFLPSVGTLPGGDGSAARPGADRLIKACTQPVLGICSGMQLLGKRSEENNGVDLLGTLSKKRCRKMIDHDLAVAAHGAGTGWYAKAGDRLFRGIEEGAYFYFVHSYAMPVNRTHRPVRITARRSPPRCRKDNSLCVVFTRSAPGAPQRSC